MDEQFQVLLQQNGQETNVDEYREYEELNTPVFVPGGYSIHALLCLRLEIQPPVVSPTARRNSPDFRCKLCLLVSL